MELILFAVFVALTVIPLFKLLPGYGLNPLWSLIAVLPVGLIILLWIMAARADEKG
ncbi:MAG: hypothetical protein NXH97_17870 [Rhodobacteraceae bacterium]|nr:hypothetical protein [Paracoccaceae bacterium]